MTITVVDPVLVDIVGRVIAAECDFAAVRGWEAAPAELPSIWGTFAELGFLELAVPESGGGSGGELADVAEVLRICGAAALPIPYAEHVFIAGQWLAAAGADVGQRAGRVMTVVPDPDAMSLTETSSGLVLDGTARRVPWARHADMVLVPCRNEAGGHSLVLVEAAGLSIEQRRNIAAEPRDTITAAAVSISDAANLGPVDPAAWILTGALARSITLAGAAQRALDMSTAYIKVREQFGRPLGKFQAVAHLLARTAEDAASARMATDSALVGLSNRLSELPFEQAVLASESEIAVAKIVSSRAATSVARMSHQMHGAIGTTIEYDLQLSTRRMWSWREEFGTAPAWSVKLGRRTVSGGGKNLWDLISH